MLQLALLAPALASAEPAAARHAARLLTRLGVDQRARLGLLLLVGPDLLGLRHATSRRSKRAEGGKAVGFPASTLRASVAQSSPISPTGADRQHGAYDNDSRARGPRDAAI